MCDELPLNCSTCGAVNMVEMTMLDARLSSKINGILRGFYCKVCGEWETVSVETAAVMDLLFRVHKSGVGSTKYQKLMYKAINKIGNLVRRVKAEPHDES